MTKLFAQITIIVLVVLAASNSPKALQQNWPAGVQLRGTVLLPDGTPASGADVLVQSTCERTSRRVVTDETGSFTITTFSPDCVDYGFKAQLKREMWLPTGNDVFYVGSNGTSPTLHLEPGRTPDPVVIRMGEQGGEAQLQVHDSATGSYLEAGITLMRRGREREATGMAQFVVSPEEGGSIRLLPVGRYRVEVDRYRCGDKYIWLAEPVRVDFDVTARERQRVVVTLDSRTVDVKSSYDNLAADRCTP